MTPSPTTYHQHHKFTVTVGARAVNNLKRGNFRKIVTKRHLCATIQLAVPGTTSNDSRVMNHVRVINFMIIIFIVILLTLARKHKAGMQSIIDESAKTIESSQNISSDRISRCAVRD
jgi:hypothetical protein